MRKRFSETRCGLTIIELLVVLATIALFSAIVIARIVIPEHDISTSVKCLRNQRQVVIANVHWMSDNMGRFPWQVSRAQGGSLEYTNEALPHFQLLSNYVFDPKILTCPSDGARAPGKRYTPLLRTNLSYFMNLDAGTNPTTTAFLSGDRHLALNKKLVPPGSFLLRGDQAVSWTSELHNDRLYNFGVVSFADGHVEVIKGAGKLKNAVRCQALGTNRLVVP
jgi:prepilin-type processing-associated H-X9-DG protein